MLNIDVLTSIWAHRFLGRCVALSGDLFFLGQVLFFMR